MTVSPSQAVYQRKRLHKESTLAAGHALRTAAEKLLPPSRIRQRTINQARRTIGCGVTQYVRMVTPRGEPTLVVASNNRACANRWCPSCAARTARKLSDDLAEVLDHVWAIQPEARALLLTLTSRNRPATPHDSHTMLTDHQKGLKTFFDYHRVKQGILGHFTSIECDFSIVRGQLTVHWHSHSLLMVDAGALSDHRYIPHAVYRTLWQRALKATYAPMVNIKAVKGDPADPSSIKRITKEVCKYALDTAGFFIRDNGELRVDPQAALAFATAVYRRRLQSCNGIFAAAKRRRSAEKRRKTSPAA